MNVLRFLIAPLLAAALLFAAAHLYSVNVVIAQKKSAHSKKQTQFHYVCPMHEDVTSKKRGTCHKCKMKLVRKAIKKQPSTGSN